MAFIRLNACCLILVAVCPRGWTDDPSGPIVTDPRLQLSLIAEQPAVRTPIGLAIDDHDRLFVLESHTHLPPADYDGPNSDRVLCFADDDADGIYERSVFASGITHGMNLAFSPDGVLHVACARVVVALPDQDENGRADRKVPAVELITNNRYPHNAILGVTFDRGGSMYVARGNNASMEYELVGRDGSRVSGYGDGGSILRCRGDGTGVSEFATGFWNPVQMKFDRFGRLLCVDNDPDARGPNRIVHVVEGGNYGHINLYGGGGNHPLQAWNGELPGTLPFAGGTGEAPCDLLDATRTGLPTDFDDSLLVTVWNEYTIERHRIVPDGVSFKTEVDILVQGDKDFRPVAIEANSRGDVFFTDWVHVDYPNHGAGRIWKLSARDDDSTSRIIRGPFDPPLESAGQRRLAEINTIDPDRRRDELIAAIEANDPFVVHAAIGRLIAHNPRQSSQELFLGERSRRRIAALILAARLPGSIQSWQLDLARQSLTDPDPAVRHAAVVWVGTRRLTQLAGELDRSIAAANSTPRLLDAYLAAKACLQPSFVAAYEAREQDKAKAIPRPIDSAWLRSIASDRSRPPTVRALAADRMPHPLDDAMLDLLDDWLAQTQPAPLQQTAIKRLRNEPGQERRLLQVALDQTRTTQVRRAAVAALGSRNGSVAPVDGVVRELLNMVADASNAEVAVEAVRALHAFADRENVAQQATEWLAFPNRHPASVETIRESLFRLAGRIDPSRPTSPEGWMPLITDGGDPIAGRNVFLSDATTCVQCHRADGAGETLGPNLSNLGQSVDRTQIARSILWPSEQFAPQYQAWKILTVDGTVHIGLQIDHGYKGSIRIIGTDGTKRRISGDEVEDYFVSKTSIMPAGLEQTMTVSQMRDLVAFLASPGTND